jgi:Kef-type K+ transport system membrane component KefB
MQTKRLILILLAAEALLLIPFFAMKFGSEVDWSPMDFATMGVMLLLTGIGIEFALRLAKDTWIKVAAVAAVLFIFVMVWGTLVHMGG